MRYPVDIIKITSEYGMRTLPGRAPVFHYGTDFSSRNKFAVAPCDIEIIKVLLPDEKHPCKFKWSNKQGMYVPDTKVPEGRAWTPYVRAVSVNDPDVSFIFKHVRAVVSAGIVNEGEKVGEIGNFGFSMGAHLHFEVLVKGENMDPVKWLNEHL